MLVPGDTPTDPLVSTVLSDPNVTALPPNTTKFFRSEPNPKLAEDLASLGVDVNDPLGIDAAFVGSDVGIKVLTIFDGAADINDDGDILGTDDGTVYTAGRCAILSPMKITFVSDNARPSRLADAPIVIVDGDKILPTILLP